MKITIKTYQYGKPGPSFQAFYLELNGIQFGTIMFSLKEAEEARDKYLGAKLTA